MTGVPEPKDPAPMWVSRLKKTPEPGDYLRFGFWLRGSPRHQISFLDACRTERDISVPMRDVQSAVERLSYVRPAGEAPSQEVAEPPRRHARRFAILATLAAFLLLATGEGLVRKFGPAAGQIYETRVGGFERVPLKDGSMVDLNTNSMIRVHFTKEQRTISLLRGEAHFKVAHNASYPFIVKSGRVRVRAVGTEFDVRRYESSHASILVTEGRVAVSDAPPLRDARGILGLQDLSGAPAVLVTAGEAGVMSKGAIHVTSVDGAEIAVRQAWRNGFVLLGDRPLIEIVAEFNRYNYRQLTIADRSIANIRLGGLYRAQLLDKFVADLGKTHGIHSSGVAGEDDVIVLNGRDARR